VLEVQVQMSANVTIMAIMTEARYLALRPGDVVALKGVAVQRAFPQAMGNVEGPNFVGRPGALAYELVDLVGLALNLGDSQDAHGGSHLQKLFGVDGLRARILKGEAVGELVEATLRYVDKLYAVLARAVADVAPAASLDITRLVCHIARAAGTASEIAEAANLSFGQLFAKHGKVGPIQRVWAAPKTNHADNGVCYDALRVAIEPENKALYVVAHVQIDEEAYVVMCLCSADSGNANLQTQMFGAGQALAAALVIPAQAAEVLGLERREYRATVKSTTHSNAGISMPHSIAVGKVFECLVICGEMAQERLVKDPQNRVPALATEIAQTTRRLVLTNSTPSSCYVTVVADLHVKFEGQNRNAEDAALRYAAGLTLAQIMLARAECELPARGEGQVASAEPATWKPDFVERTRERYPTNGKAREVRSRDFTNLPINFIFIFYINYI
jgi:hypothetical protein